MSVFLGQPLTRPPQQL